MLPFWVPMMTAAAGALMDKKKPLRGALLGGGMGAAPGLLGMGSVASPGASSMGSLLGQAGQAAGAAQQVAGLMPQEQGAPAPQPLQQLPGPDDSGFLQAQLQQRQTDEEQKRMRKMMEQAFVQKLMGGGNGLA